MKDAEFEMTINRGNRLMIKSSEYQFWLEVEPESLWNALFPYLDMAETLKLNEDTEFIYLTIGEQVDE